MDFPTPTSLVESLCRFRGCRVRVVGGRGIVSATLRLGYERDRRYYASSHGDSVEYEVRMVGVSVALVSHVEGPTSPYGIRSPGSPGGSS